jgi:hypothetical protein
MFHWINVGILINHPNRSSSVQQLRKKLFINGHNSDCVNILGVVMWYVLNDDKLQILVGLKKSTYVSVKG